MRPAWSVALLNAADRQAAAAGAAPAWYPPLRTALTVVVVRYFAGERLRLVAC